MQRLESRLFREKRRYSKTVSVMSEHSHTPKAACSRTRTDSAAVSGGNWDHSLGREESQKESSRRSQMCGEK
jgi:hypothetical protein